MNLKPIYFIFFCLLTVNMKAQNKQIRAYTLADGLPQSQVYDILQDDYGYIWLGTQGGGIARFDGKNFKVWNKKKGLISNYIHSLFYINDSLLIGTKYGLTIKSKNVFANYESPQINKIIKNSNQYLFATNRGLFALFNDIKLQKININSAIDKSIINDIKFINNWYWIATNRGLWKVSSDFLEKQKLSNFDFKSVINYGDLVFAASYNKGVFVINELDKLEIISETKRVNSLNILHQDELWIATDNAGIIILNADNYKFIEKINKKSGLPVLHVRKVISDKQSNIWLATSGGIFKVFKNNFKHFDKNSGLKGNSVYAITKWKNGIVFSNADSGLMKIDTAGLQEITQDKGFLNVKSRALASDKNTLFAGTDGKGLLILHSTTKDSISMHFDDNNLMVTDTIAVHHQYVDTLTTADGLSSNWIKKIYVNNKIWVGHYSSGITSFTYNSTDKKINNLKQFGLKQGLKDLFINDITSDKQGIIWYATKNGHIGKIYKNRVYDLGKVLQVNTSIRTLLFYKNQLFIATSGKGIWWTDLTTPLKFKPLIGVKQLYSDNIYQLIFDANNNLWVGSENGVDKITLDKNNTITELQHFGRNDGFLGIETCLNAVTKDDKENLWFGTINGITKYQPSITIFTQQKPSIFLENVEVMNESLDSIPLQQFSKNKQILHLKPNQNLLAFYFKTVDINHPKEVQYRWKLDGFKWSTWNTDTKVNLASDYGKHIFKVQSRNLNWIESNVVSFQFEREKPLVKKTWFIWTSLISLGVILLSLGYLYFRRLKKRNKLEKERLQLENKLLTLEQKALRLQMNPHFIFNVLNGIKAMSISDVKNMHTTINKFATLLRATLTNSRKNTISLSEEITTLKNYIEVEQLMSEKLFTYQIDVDTDMDTEEILIPPMLIQPFVENAIRHGIMAVNHKGALLIQFKTEDNFLYCTIIDNGIGINKSKANKIKSSHQSMALEVTKERIAHLSGTNTLIIKEITNKNNTLAGTKVSFKIPLVTDY